MGRFRKNVGDFQNFVRLFPQNVGVFSENVGEFLVPLAESEFDAPSVRTQYLGSDASKLKEKKREPRKGSAPSCHSPIVPSDIPSIHFHSKNTIF